MAYDLGDVVTLTLSVKDSTGAAANATACAVTITLPDGTTATPSVTNPSTGSYAASYTPTLAGWHAVRWVATGTNAMAHTDSFTVYSGSDVPLVSLADAKTFLNITSTNSDEEIRTFILKATDIAERRTGRRFRAASFVETYSSTESAVLVLRQFPVLSVTSVVEDGITLTAGTAYVVDTTNGTITRGTSTSSLQWAQGNNNITVTYRAGAVNPTAQALVEELTKHLWRTQRGASPMAMGGGDEFIPGSSNIFTYRVLELIEMLRVPGFA